MASLRPDGRVAIGNASRLPTELLEEARQHREDMAALLAARAAETAAPGSIGLSAIPSCPDTWLRSIAGSVARALAQGACRERDPAGWLVLVRPDGRRAMVAPHVVASLAEVGLLPSLPPEQEMDTSDLGCPPAWSEPFSPPSGSWCTACGRFTQTGGRWWREAERPGWCCWTCHPPDGRPATAVVEVRT
ncbi:hypothetical protein JMJ56_19535 [Belnapia sp. T18]|uniref:Uncharacterized protein n=1 Tax=Belnapia arida TaxID=2804533 RepID=A0ABS1U8E5_9PROT|nr:hypothetical protein [Belnapia arida]MBL6080214.1 hypothetical protein [Belnapia arida]